MRTLASHHIPFGQSMKSQLCFVNKRIPASRCALLALSHLKPENSGRALLGHLQMASALGIWWARFMGQSTESLTTSITHSIYARG